MSTFSRVYKPYTFGGGVGGICGNQHFFHTLLTFGLVFIIFMGIFGTQKMLMCTLFLGGGSQKVYRFVLS